MGTNNYTITFPQGIYSLSSMNDEISRQTNDENDNGYLITLQGDSANSSVYLTFNDPTLTINCNHSDSALQLLGFPMSTGILGPYAETGTQYSTGLPAILNTTSSIIMTCDACGGLCYKNGSSSSVVASILINTVPFQVIDYEPINPPRIHLSKYSLDSIEFTLYNQNLTPIDMNSNNGTQPYEAWTAVIEIDEYTKEGRLI